MPSPLTVPVAVVDSIEAHPNADRLEIANVLGWRCIVSKGEYVSGDVVVYFPPDTVLPEKLSDKLGVTKYLSKGRIRACRLRGEKSFGLVTTPEKKSWNVGDNVADYYGVKKYEPPVRGSGSRGAGGGLSERLPEMIGFPKYTDIDNARHHMHLFSDDEEVVVTEKIHGTNSRVGILNGEWMAGSHGVRRRRPFGFRVAGEVDTIWKKLKRAAARAWFGLKKVVHFLLIFHRFRRWINLRPLITTRPSLYWHPLTIPAVADLCRELAEAYDSVVVYGEIYGPGVQGLTYGITEGHYGYAIFDIKVNGRYMDYEEVEHYCDRHLAPHVPLLYIGPRANVDFAKISEGKTRLGADHIREGVVVKPVHERTDPRLGRIIVKYVSDTYLLEKIDNFAEI